MCNNIIYYVLLRFVGICALTAKRTYISRYVDTFIDFGVDN